MCKKHNPNNDYANGVTTIKKYNLQIHNDSQGHTKHCLNLHNQIIFKLSNMK